MLTLVGLHYGQESQRTNKRHNKHLLGGDEYKEEKKPTTG
jgi:hypothetical protein